ncbi:winged helix DNA-binding domain-containing protein, partial [Listeria seeligeri]|nr:winged helix DNA-binding domain-containing protein [Listeria seeligeri]
MDTNIIIENRFINQKLAPITWLDSPEDIVAHFGAMQAQNYGQALWT